LSHSRSFTISNYNTLTQYALTISNYKPLTK
jgi:hypothetical protein